MSLAERLQGGGAELRRFGGEEGGAVAMIFGLAALPLIFMVGAALDYSGASNLRVHLQSATDGSNLKLCQMVNPSQKELDAAAAKLMAGYMGKTALKIDPVKASNNPRSVELSTHADFPTGILGAFGYKLIPVSAEARCVDEPKTFEIALVVDTTGSMNTSHNGVSKIQSLRTAATDFINFVFDHPQMSKSTKMSLVPFAPSVALNPLSHRSVSWLDQKSRSPHHWSFIKGGKAARPAGMDDRFDLFDKLKVAQPSWDWKGCVEALPYPLSVQDGSPSPSTPGSYYVPMLAADESGDGGSVTHKDGSGKDVLSLNSYLNDFDGSAGCPASTDEDVRTGQACKYANPTGAKTAATYGSYSTPVGPNASCASRPLTRLTTSRSTLLSEVSALNAEGNTNIHQGFHWGWQTISPNGVFKSDAAAYDKKANVKVIVLMTDGMNTFGAFNGTNVLRTQYNAYGYLKNADGSDMNARLPPGNANPANDGAARAAMDAMTLESCKNASSSANKVMVYSVGFSVPNDPIDAKGLELLKACAGVESRFFIATSGAELVAAFKQIAQDISGLRLTN